MNAKTSSIIMVCSFIGNIVLLIAIVFFGYKMIMINNYLPMNCMSTIYINAGSNNDNVITGNVKIVFHITDDGEIAVNEYGVLKYKKQEYIVDRTGEMNMSKTAENGYHKVIKGQFIDNPLDTAPIELVEKLTSSQSVLFYKIEKLNDVTWRISDLKRTIFICRK